MKAAYSPRYGSVSELRVGELPDPVPGEGEAVVDIAAAAVNFPDILILGGSYHVPFPPPIIPGSEFAGTVRSVGTTVAGLRIGDRVAGSVAVGAFAEQIAVPARILRPVPRHVDMAEAAAFGVTYLTAYHALRSVAAVRPGEWVLVLGAAGGVGLSSVDVAKLLGARVLAAASSPGKLEACLKRGADAIIDYRTGNLRDEVKQLTGGGADVVIDPVGGDYAEPALRAMRYGGRFVCIGFASGKIPAVPLNLVLLKGVSVQGMELGSFNTHYPAQTARDEAEAFEHFHAGRLRPLIGARFALDDVVQAMRTVSERRAVGKVVIFPGSGPSRTAQPGTLPGLEALGPVEANCLPVQVRVFKNVLNQRGVLLGAAKATRAGNAGREPGQCLLTDRLHDRRPHCPRSDRDHADAQRAEIPRGDQGQADHPRLGRRIRGLTDLALECGDARGRDDRAALPVAVRLVLRDRSGRQPEHVIRPGQVQFHGLGEAREVGRGPVPLNDPLRHAVAAVRGDRVPEHAELPRVSHHRRDAVLVGHIGPYIAGPGAKLGCELPGPVIGQVGDDHGGAGGSQAPHGRLAKSAGPPGHEHYAVG
jgi:NADPH2:quinone reductase